MSGGVKLLYCVAYASSGAGDGVNRSYWYSATRPRASLNSTVAPSNQISDGSATRPARYLRRPRLQFKAASRRSIRAAISIPIAASDINAKPLPAPATEAPVGLEHYSAFVRFVRHH